MVTIGQKTTVLLTAYGGQETLNYILKVLGTEVSHEILQEAKPVPPLKTKVELGKTQLLLDYLDENYLLALAKYNKRKATAQRGINNDTTLQDITYRLLVSNNPVDTNNSEADLKQYLIDLTNELAQVTPEEIAASIPADQTI